VPESETPQSPGQDVKLRNTVSIASFIPVGIFSSILRDRFCIKSIRRTTIQFLHPTSGDIGILTWTAQIKAKHVVCWLLSRCRDLTS